MGKNPKKKTSEKQPAHQLHDSLSKWKSEISGGQVTTLAVIRVEANERLLIPFTMQSITVDLHYLDAPAIHSYVHCLGDECILCQAGKQKSEHDLLPVFDLENEAVGVLNISPALKINSLRPQLVPVGERLMRGERLLLTVAAKKPGHYVVSIQELPANVDDGRGIIATFLKQFEGGQIDLASVYQRFSNDELASIPQISKILRAKGLRP